MSLLTDSYRKAQGILGIDAVLKEQLRVVGAKSWTEMKLNERERLLDALRVIWNKGKESK